MIIIKWMLFILTMSSARAEENYRSRNDKESRFLSIFAVTPVSRPLPPLSPGSSPVLTARPAPLASGRCADRLETALDHIKRRQMSKARDLDVPIQMIDLDGYSIHQHLRSAPMNMYVTRMRVRLPQNQNWVRIERCHFDPRNISLETRLLFNDLTISGSVNLQEGVNDLDRSESVRDYERDSFYDRRSLRRHSRYKRDDRYKDEAEIGGYDEEYERSRKDCNMILRLRKAGIGFFTQPLNQSPGRFNVKTDSEFIEPGFISVYAYGCERYVLNKRKDSYHDKNDYRHDFNRRHKRQADLFTFLPYGEDNEASYSSRSYQYGERNYDNHRVEKSKLFGTDDRLEDFDDISREMEDIFTKGIRSLLTTYMQKELQPAIKETLMRNLGYTLSYGR